MKVRVFYHVVRDMEIEVPFTRPAEDCTAEEEARYYDNVEQCLQETIPQIDKDADCWVDIIDWDEVESLD